VIQRAAGGEADAPLQSVLLDEPAIAVFQPLAHVHELDARLDEGLGVVADLAMDFGGMAQLLVERGLEALVGSLLGGAEAVRVALEGVLLDVDSQQCAIGGGFLFEASPFRG